MRKCFILICIFMSCNLRSEEDVPDFYGYSLIGRSILRLPLIEPYLMHGDRSQHYWGIDNCMKEGPLIDFPWLDSVAIYDTTFILAYSHRIVGWHGKMWFVVDVASRNGKFFETEKDYWQYLNLKRITSIKMHDIFNVYDSFNVYGVLPPEWPKHKKPSWWVPDSLRKDIKITDRPE